MPPHNPKDPDTLSLQPGSGGKADFSNVRSHSDTVPADRGGGKADFSNVHAHSDTVPADSGAREQSYTVRKGDSLSAIAQRQYGKASRWRAIFEANRDQLDNPDLIHPGQVLKLPAPED